MVYQKPLTCKQKYKRSPAFAIFVHHCFMYCLHDVLLLLSLLLVILSIRCFYGFAFDCCCCCACIFSAAFAPICLYFQLVIMKLMANAAAAVAAQEQRQQHILHKKSTSSTNKHKYVCIVYTVYEHIMCLIYTIGYSVANIFTHILCHTIHIQSNSSSNSDSNSNSGGSFKFQVFNLLFHNISIHTFHFISIFQQQNKWHTNRNETKKRVMLMPQYVIMTFTNTFSVRARKHYPTRQIVFRCYFIFTQQNCVTKSKQQKTRTLQCKLLHINLVLGLLLPLRLLEFIGLILFLDFIVISCVWKFKPCRHIQIYLKPLRWK